MIRSTGLARGRRLLMDDEKEFLGCPLLRSFGHGPRPGKELSQSLVVRCGGRWAYAKIADQNRIRITADWDSLKKFSGPHQSRSIRHETGPNRHPAPTRLLMSRQRRTSRWSHHPMRKMIGKVAEAASCAWEGFVRTCRDRAAPARGRFPAPPRKPRWAV